MNKKRTVTSAECERPVKKLKPQDLIEAAQHDVNPVQITVSKDNKKTTQLKSALKAKSNKAPSISAFEKKIETRQQLTGVNVKKKKQFGVPPVALSPSKADTANEVEEPQVDDESSKDEVRMKIEDGADGRSPEEIMVEKTLKQVARKRRKRETDALTQIAIAERSRNVKLFNKLISKLGNNKQMGLALKAYSALLASEITPTVYTLTNLVNACVRCGELTAAKDFINQFKQFKVKPNEVTFTALIKGTTESGFMQQSYLLLHAMLRRKLAPNFRTFNILLRGCVQWGSDQLAERLISDMRKLQVDMTEYNYEYLVKVFCQNGRLQKAEEAVRLMSASGFAPTAAIFAGLATSHALAGDDTAARSNLKLCAAAAAEEAKQAPANDKDRLFLKTRLQEVESEASRVKQFLALPKHSRRSMHALRPASAPSEGKDVVSADASVRHAGNVLFFLDTEQKGGNKGQAVAESVDAEALFGNSHPVYLEVCSGHGDWVVARAHSDTHTNWLALEMRFDRCHQIWLKARLQGVANVCVLHGEASQTVRSKLPRHSLSRAFINHPDPPNWEDNKQRLICDTFLAELHAALKPRAQLVVVTDDAEYAATIAGVFAESAALFESAHAPRPFSTTLPEDWGSSYFDRFFNERKQFTRYYFEYTKLGQ
jgi:tRNA (guanine-N7-)-methyltransferase